MKRKQGLAIITLALIIFLSSTTTSSWASSSKISIQFKDTKPTDWYMPTVSKLVELKGIAGFPDGTFKPELQITKGEFIKIIVGSLGFDEGPSTTGHWANNYRRRAALIGLIDASEFSKLDETITRYEMSKVIVKSIEYKGESHVENREKYMGQINDYYNIPSEYKDYVLKAYTKGLISGYPDGEFKGNKGLSRAEASAVIMRVLDPTERKLQTEPKETDKATKTRELTEEDIKRLQGYDLVKSGAYIGFEEYYKNKKDSAEYWVRAIQDKILTPKNFKVHGLDGKTMKPVFGGYYSILGEASEYEFITDPKLVYQNVVSDDNIRGILRVKYDKENTEGLKIGKYYERDVEFILHEVAEIIKEKRDGKIVDVWTGKSVVYIHSVKHLSLWKEVK